MQNKRLYWIVTALVLVGAGFSYLSFHRREPAYQGVPLGRWLEDCDLDKAELGIRAQRAVREIGTDAIPTLLRMLGEQDARLKRRLMGNSIDFRIAGFRVTSATCRQVRAAAGCRVLGPQAEPAIPALVELLPQSYVGERVAQALSAIGPKAVHSLTAELTNRLANHRAAAATALLRFGSNAVPAIPALAAAVEDPDAKVRRCAAEALGSIGSNGGPVVVTALTTALRDEDALVRRCGIAFVCSLGTKAKEAAPAVRDLADDSDPEVRRLVPIALRNFERQVPARIEP